MATLAAATAGLAAAPFVAGPQGIAWAAPVAVAGLALAAVRPRVRGAAVLPWLALVAGTAAIAGLGAGTTRLAAIDAGAFEGPAGRPATATGFVTAVPRRSDGMTSVRIDTADGRLLVETPEPVPELPVGGEVQARGTLRHPSAWQEDYLGRFGIAQVLEADRIWLTGLRRGGVEALTDGIRDRAEAALERGMPEREAALARGFVLGQDDRIDPRTIADFKRSGLAHLLAVSGQNVLLLALLAIPLLAALGLSLRARLAWVLVLIALYVPITGAGPSIQRAAVMGAAGVVAVLAGRPRSRWYAVLLAAFATLAVNPRSGEDVGWQLSFAAVVGILLWAGPLRDLLLRAHRRDPGGRSWRRALAEGAALTIAATLATAPLMAHHFEAVSLAALPANLLALPAVAPVMWLGMLVAMAGQAPFLPVEPLNQLNALLIAYIAQIADWLGEPGWSVAGVTLPGPELAASYCALAAAGWIAWAWALRRAGLGVRTPGFRPAHRGSRRGMLARTVPLLTLAIAASALALAGPWPSGEAASPSDRGLEITVLDVGQGDAILLEPPDGDAVLVDAGPPGADLAGKLEDEGVERLAALAVTHDQLDHAGGAAEVLSALPVGSMVYASVGDELLGAADANHARTARVAEGQAIRSGDLTLDVLWPPPELLSPRDTSTGDQAPGSKSDADHTGDDLNRLSLVLLARWRGFSMLLTGDAEAEAVPIESGPVDVLKVAHHGSEDAGLDRLLDLAAPRVAVISVGESNPYGHPTATTLATLEEHGTAVLRTDRDGDVEIEVGDHGWTAHPE